MKQKFFKSPVLLAFLCALPSLVPGAILNSPRQIPFLTPQAAVASIDLNEDGIPDLIAGGDPTGFENGKISVMLGKGNGSFVPYREYTVGTRPNEFSSPYIEAIKTADLNNDGNTDVVVAHNGIRSIIGNASTLFITVLLGDGRGNLQAADAYRFFDGTDDNLVTAIDLADLNGDGFLDITLGLATRNLGKIYFMKNLGGTFQVMGPRPVIASVEGIGHGHFNNDLNTDIVVSSRQGMTVLYGNGNFLFPDGVILQDREDLGDLAARDFNGDGKTDLAVAEFLTPHIRVFLQGTKGFPTVPVLLNTSFDPDILRSTDFDHDGKTDLVAANGAAGGLQVFYGSENGSFTPFPAFSAAPAADIAFADFDQNGHADIAVGNYDFSSNLQVGILLNSPNSVRYYTDFDGDRKSDFTVYRPGSGTWWTFQSSNSAFQAVRFGLPDDRPVPGNYDGDNRADIAVYRDGVWFILQSSDSSFKAEYWGLAADVPVHGDYDNDGKTNVAVYRPSEGIWYIKNDTGFDAFRWGLTTDRPTPGDYDGDGKTDIAVFRPSDGVWYITRSSDGNFMSAQFGISEDKPVQADFDGDGMADIAVFRPSISYWFILQSSNGEVRYQRFGLPDDIPAPNDFDADNRSDIAVFRPADGTWYLLRSSNDSFGALKWGTSGDIPVRPQ
jgi:hypothetical protein